MEFITKLFNSNYYTSYILFGTSIYLYCNKINYVSLKKLIKNKVENLFENQFINTNDSIDYSLLSEYQNYENKYDSNYVDNIFRDDFNYFYYCYNQ